VSEWQAWAIIAGTAVGYATSPLAPLVFDAIGGFFADKYSWLWARWHMRGLV
jgi:hypothetical protein